MVQISEARLRANRLNAQKSTGPRSAEGKAASRQNSARHGLASEGIALPDDLARQVEERLPAWVAEFRPQGALEAWLVGQLVVASVQLDRVREHNQAHDSVRRARAAVAWDDDRRAEVEALGARLAAEPARVAAELVRSARGCLWLAERWRALGHALESAGAWSDPERARALDLLGIAAELRPAHELSRPDLAPDRLRALVAEQLDALDARIDAGLSKLDATLRTLTAEGRSFDDSPPARLLRRYELACARRFDWLLIQLQRLRAGRVATVSPADAPASPIPIPTSAPSATLAAALVREALAANRSNPTPVAAASIRPAIAPAPNRQARRAERARRRREPSA